MYGHGSVEAITSASAANNAALSGAYVPALVFGIPGDSITAIVIGVLIMKGLTPGPTIFTTSPELVMAVYVVFLTSNLLMIPLGVLAIHLGRQVLLVPPGRLYPIILLLCVVGAFATNNSVFDIWLIAMIGVLVFLMERNGYPVAPMVLGLVLGRIVEEQFINSMIKANGAFVPFVDRPIAGVLAVLTIVVWTFPLLRAGFGRFLPAIDDDVS